MLPGRQQEAARALSIFARVEPQHKSQLVDILKHQVNSIWKETFLSFRAVYFYSMVHSKRYQVSVFPTQTFCIYHISFVLSAFAFEH